MGLENVKIRTQKLIEHCVLTTNLPYRKSCKSPFVPRSHELSREKELKHGFPPAFVLLFLQWEGSVEMNGEWNCLPKFTEGLQQVKCLNTTLTETPYQSL